MTSTTATPTTGVVITGGASGIGRATAHAVAAVGRPVAIWDVNGDAAEDAAKEVAGEHAVASIGIGLDVSEHRRFGDAIASSRDTMGSIGGLVHAAGITGVSPVDSLDEDVWDATLAIHLTAAAVLMRDLTPDLLANPGSAVVLVSSIEAIHGHGAIPAYCAAKAGMLGLVHSSTDLLAPRGVRVNAVCPGFIETPMLAPMLAAPGVREAYDTRIPMKRLGQPDDIAKAVRFLLSDDASYVTGHELVVDGGVTRTTM
jgi:NAD(P)-dependent dehydrogenase (short-subunit alcohol dehydrogenase family)